jgi:hypothetical protein
MPRGARATAPAPGMACSVLSRYLFLMSHGLVRVRSGFRPADHSGHSSQFSASSARPPHRFATPLAAEHGAAFPWARLVHHASGVKRSDRWKPYDKGRPMGSKRYANQARVVRCGVTQRAAASAGAVGRGKPRSRADRRRWARTAMRARAACKSEKRAADLTCRLSDAAWRACRANRDPGERGRAGSGDHEPSSPAAILMHRPSTATLK